MIQLKSLTYTLRPRKKQFRSLHLKGNVEIDFLTTQPTEPIQSISARVRGKIILHTCSIDPANHCERNSSVATSGSWVCRYSSLFSLVGGIRSYFWDIGCPSVATNFLWSHWEIRSNARPQRAGTFRPKKHAFTRLTSRICYMPAYQIALFAILEASICNLMVCFRLRREEFSQGQWWMRIKCQSTFSAVVSLLRGLEGGCGDGAGRHWWSCSRISRRR